VGALSAARALAPAPARLESTDSLLRDLSAQQNHEPASSPTGTDFRCPPQRNSHLKNELRDTPLLLLLLLVTQAGKHGDDDDCGGAAGASASQQQPRHAAALLLPAEEFKTIRQARPWPCSKST